MSQPTTHCEQCNTATCKGCRTKLAEKVPDRRYIEIDYANPAPRGSQKDDNYTGGYKILY